MLDATADLSLTAADAAPEATTEAPPPRTEIAFVDTGVQGYQALVEAMHPGVEVVLIDSTRDGLAQVAEALAGRMGVDAVHVVSHGEAGLLALGSARVTLGTLESYSAELATIRAALSDDADLLVYGCDVAAGETGAAFVQALAHATGADIAASEDLTGSAALGGDWVLEATVGDVSTGVASVVDAAGLEAESSLLLATTGRKLIWTDDLTNDYGADNNNGSLFSAGLDGQGLVALVNTQPSLEQVGLAYDSRNSKLYFVQSDGTIARANPDGTGSQVVVGSGAAPAIAVAPSYQTDGRLFYSSSANGGSIISAKLDGTGATTIVSDLDPTVGNTYQTVPVTMEIDTVNGKLYWLELDNAQGPSGNYWGGDSSLLISTEAMSRLCGHSRKTKA